MPKEYYGKRNKEISVQIEGRGSEEKRLSDWFLSDIWLTSTQERRSFEAFQDNMKIMGTKQLSRTSTL
jgi:hypothetical protein